MSVRQPAADVAPSSRGDSSRQARAVFFRPSGLPLPRHHALRSCTPSRQSSCARAFTKYGFSGCEITPINNVQYKQATCAHLLHFNSCASQPLHRSESRLAMSRSSSSPAFDFFFTSTCACARSGKCKNSLCITSLLFFPAAQGLFNVGAFTIGAFTAALGVTSVVYHATHLSRVRASDILLLWSTGIFGVAHAVRGIWARGAVPGFIVGLLGVFSLCVIFVSPRFKVDIGEGKTMIPVQWHALVHIIAALSFQCLASGFGPPSADEAPIVASYILHAWCAAGTFAALLIAGSAATYAALAPPASPSQQPLAVCLPCHAPADALPSQVLEPLVQVAPRRSERIRNR